MSDYDRNVAAFPGARAGQSVAVDVDLRAHMLRVYNYMAGAVGLTGIVSWLTYQASGGDAIRIVAPQHDRPDAVRRDGDAAATARSS